MRRLIKSALPIWSIMLVSCFAYPQSAWASERADREQITIRVSVIPQSKAVFESRLRDLGSKNNLRQICQIATGLSELELASLDGIRLDALGSGKVCESAGTAAFSPASQYDQLGLRTVLIRPI